MRLRGAAVSWPQTINNEDGIGSRYEGSCRIYLEEGLGPARCYEGLAWRFRAWGLLLRPSQAPSLGSPFARCARVPGCFAVPGGNSNCEDRHRPGYRKPVPVRRQARSGAHWDNTAAAQPWLASAQQDGVRRGASACRLPSHAPDACVRRAWRAWEPGSSRPKPQ